ncbi:hypothetical protein [Streptomyces sp. NPDC006324]|uniref:hypothetical protein n=1 Tax=Streptomyces sp. NPDC006324 TaxID=3156751 RepID=UPI0033B7BA25
MPRYAKAKKSFSHSHAGKGTDRRHAGHRTAASPVAYQVSMASEKGSRSSSPDAVSAQWGQTAEPPMPIDPENTVRPVTIARPSVDSQRRSSVTYDQRGPGVNTGRSWWENPSSATAIPSSTSHAVTRAPSASASSGVASRSTIVW